MFTYLVLKVSFLLVLVKAEHKVIKVFLKVRTQKWNSYLRF